MYNIRKGKTVSGGGRILLCLLLAAVLLLEIPFTALAAVYPDTFSLSTVCVGADGKKYQIMASYGEDAGIPEDAVLAASAVTEQDAAFADYVEQAFETLGCTASDEAEVRLFDISIVSGSDASVHYQPAEGALVEVRVRLAAAPENELEVVHFGETETEVLSSDVTGRTVSFETAGFSVYALIDMPEIYSDTFVESAADFDLQPLYISATVSSRTYYMSSGIASVSAYSAIARTAENSTAGAVPYYFEKLSGTDAQYYIYYLDGTGARKYVKMTTNKSMAYVNDASSATAFTVEPSGDASGHRYYIRTSAKQSGKYYYLNLRKDTSGVGFGGSDYGPLNNLESAGSELLVETELPRTLEISDLDGKTYGIVSIGEYGNAFALSDSALSASAIGSLSVAARANPLSAGGKVVVSVGDDIPMFTFHDDGNGQYLVSTSDGVSTKYLSVRKYAAVLVDEPDAFCHLSARLGTDENAGKLCLSCGASGGGTLNATNYGAGGFTGKYTADAMSYFYFAEKTELENDDLVPYTADKISVSEIRNGAKVVIYTRVWDNDAKEYVFYGVNHDGSLVRLYDQGETIRWSGTQINTMLWEFTEYYYWLTTIPNHYYEFRNTYTGKYLAPQVHSGQILANGPIGVNLNGRRKGQHYSTILAWDNYRYDYAGLRAGDGTVESVRMSKAQDFYFAVMHPEEGELSTADTIDNNDYGITMKMVEFPRNRESGGRNGLQTEVIGNSTYTNNLMHSSPNLVSNTLDENGYPTALLTQRSLEELFGSATTVNHLFLTEVYQESGYFQYDSTQNFATLLDEYGNISNTFTVYNELGTPEVSTNSQGHSQFMPYNDLNTEIISAYTNVKDVFNEPLELDDPRLGEQMYSIPANQANYHFGMVMEASFVQSKDGKDAWGHDIIFEFAGDDDMWFYVDGELILDLGGIHSALVGKINYSTGEVQIPHTTEETGNHATPVYTTLREIFANNYIARKKAEDPNSDLTIDSPEVVEYLNRFFTEGTSVFKDYTSHTMKMFYMERGAGASNLVMRFNLTTSQEGQLLLGKEIIGTDKNDYSGAEFPFQIYYKNAFGDFVTVKRSELFTDGKTADQYEGVTFVNYADRTEPVKYEALWEGYADVFFIKPGETAEIQFPSEEMEYFIRECRIDQSVFDEVYANSVQLDPVQNGDYYDFSTAPEVIGRRKIVLFENHVDEDALMTLSITKELYNLYDREEDRLHYADDDTGFRFRVYIGEDLEYYRFGDYFVKDPNGYYCKFDYDLQKFVPVGGGITDYAQLTEEQREDCRFTTSPSGAIDQIPADFVVEIRDLFFDTRFKVEEQEADVPKGYGFIEYLRTDGTLHADEGETANTGTIHRDEDPTVIVKNHRGWGLTVEKAWTDDSFMTSHDNVYFGVFWNGTLLDGTLRQMKTEVTENNPVAEASLYYYFPNLLEGSAFADYQTREVTLTNPAVDENGYVTAYDAITVLGDGDGMTHGGVPVQTGVHTDYDYHVYYEEGELTGPGLNVREDVVTNNRPGLRIVKVDGNGDPLPGAEFTLRSADGDDFEEVTYVSDSEGLVTVAYPESGRSYILTEVSTPDGYSALIDSMTLCSDDGNLVVTCENADAYSVQSFPEDGLTVLTVKNYASEFIAKKVDAYSDDPVEGARFALYRQVEGKNGQMRKDYYPLTGYADLVTDADGVIPGIDDTLPEGTYYLDEIEAADGYRLLDTDVCFTVDSKGDVTVVQDRAAPAAPAGEEGDAALTSPEVVSALNSENKLVITLKIPNQRTFESVSLNPQTLVADFGLDIRYDVTLNNFDVPADSVYEYIGVVPMDEFDGYGKLTAPKTILAETGTPYQGAFGTISVDRNGNTHYTIDTMSFTGEDTFCLAAHVTRIKGKAADVYVFEKITYLPATTIYYEDDFVADSNYHDGVESEATGHNFGKWSRVTSGDPRTEQAADLAASEASNIFGYDPAYTECATYSNNGAHIVSVGTVNGGNGNKNWPYMEFDFAGTGFDLISVTGSDTGVFTVSVYKTSIDAAGNVTVGARVNNQPVNTYYGCGYGRLYLTSDGAATLEDTGSPLYRATDAQIEEASGLVILQTNGKFQSRYPTYYDTDGSITESERYYDPSGNVTETPYYIHKTDKTVTAAVPAGEEASYEPNYAYAYAEAWMPDASSTQSLYQIPVIKVRDLAYGTYRAHIEPRFTTRYGHWETVDGYDYFDLYVDAFRIYDPAGRDGDGVIASSVIQTAYDKSDEAYERFTTLKRVVVGAESLGTVSGDGKEAVEGAVVVDGSRTLDSASLEDYKAFGPNNELYLDKGMSVAFELRSTEIPSDVQIHIKKVSAGNPALKVTYYDNKGTVYTGRVEVASSTDLSYSILDLIGSKNVKWAKQRNGDSSSGLVIITNDGADESVLSVTNLKWTFAKQGGSIKYMDGSSTVTISPKNVVNIKRVMAFTKRDLHVAASDEPAYEDGAVIMTVTSGTSVSSLVVRDTDGNVIDPSLLTVTYEDLNAQERQWTVEVEESEGGEYVFSVYAESDGFVSGESLPISVTVEGKLDEDPTVPDDADPGAQEPGEDGGQPTSRFFALFERIRRFMLRLRELLRMLLSYFGVQLD